MAGDTRDRPSWHRIALPASIALNLFLAALIGGHLLRDHRMEFGRGPQLARALAHAEASLPPKDAAAFGAVMRRDAPHFAQAAQQLATARRELARQITDDQFDPVAVRQALAAWRAAWGRFLDDFGASLVDALAQVSPEGRRKLIAERQLARQDIGD